MHRVAGGSATVGASSGNEIVVRARGVYGRHVRLFERDGNYHLDLFKGIETVQVNGRDFFGGKITVGDRIVIGEATLTVVEASTPMRTTPGADLPPPTDLASPPGPAASPGPGSGATHPDPAASPGSAPPGLPMTEVEYRGLRLAAYRLCRGAGSPEDLATELTDFLDRELPPSEWAVGELSGSAGFRPLASTFRESPALPPRMLQDLRGGERLARSETVAGILTLIVEPAAEGAEGSGRAAILVRETPRLAARAVLFLEELVQVAGIAFLGAGAAPDGDSLPRSTAEVLVPASASPAPESTLAETVLRQTDDLKKIVETVEREVIDRAMRRVEGNQSRGAQILNISRGSLIAKLKEFGIPDYRYLRRERGRRG